MIAAQRIALVGLALACAVSCGKKDPPSSTKKGDDGDEQAQPGGADDGKIGIAACDKYIAMYGPCVIDKAPKSVRKQTKEAFDQSIEAWKLNAKAGDDARRQLKDTCKQLVDALPKGCDG